MQCKKAGIDLTNNKIGSPFSIKVSYGYNRLIDQDIPATIQ
jgi:hypothetical protein